MSNTTLRIPMSLSEILFFGWRCYYPWEEFKRLLRNRHLEVQESDILKIAHHKRARNPLVWVDVRFAGDKHADFIFPANSEAGKILIEHFHRTSGGQNEELPKYKFHWFPEVRAYFKYSPSLWYMLTAFLFSMIWFSLKMPSPEFFLRENCEQKCAALLAASTRLLLFITLLQVLGIIVPALNFWRAKRQVKNLNTIGAVRTEFALLALVIGVLSFQFVVKLSGPTGHRAVLLYSKWYNGEPVKLSPEEKTELASEKPAK